MTEKTPAKSPKKPVLSQALRANLAKRKAQARAMAASEDVPSEAKDSED